MLALLTLLLAAPAHPPAAPTPALFREEGQSIFGEPLVVNGKRIPDEDIKNFLIHAYGRNQVAWHKVQVIIDDEVRQRAWLWALDQVGGDVSQDVELMNKAKGLYEQRLQQLQAELKVPEEDYQAEYDRRVQEFKARYPLLDADSEIARAYQSVEWFQRQLRQAMLFDRVFLPDDPANWPPVTVEAFMADPGGGELLLQDAKDSYAQRMQWKEERGLERLPPDDDLLKQIHRQIVRDAVFKVVEFRTPADGLPAGQCLWADTNGDGQPELALTTEELWAEIQPILIERDIAEAKQWLALTTATRDRMEKEGIALSPEECAKVYGEWASTLEDTTFSIELAATANQQFPSTDSWREYFCLMKGFERSLGDTLERTEEGEPSPILKQHFERAQKILGLAQVDVDVLLVSAYDFPTNVWKADGWKHAKAKANELMKKIEQNRLANAEQRKRQLAAEAKGEEAAPSKDDVPDPNLYWNQLLDDHSDWWDPPPPETGKQSDIIYKKKGRFGPRYRNDMLGFMGESPYGDFLWGGTVTDRAFFDQEVNTIAGPFRGPMGYYITRVNRRMPPSRPLTLSDPWQYDRIKENYVEMAFSKYAHEALDQADVKGLPTL